MWNFILVFLGIFFIYTRFEAGFLKKSIIHFDKNRNNNIKIAHISDIHIGKMFVSKTKIRNILLNEKPDVILLTGDYIENTKQLKKLLKLFEVAFKDFKVYLCYGNHDLKVFKQNHGFQIEFENKIKSLGIEIIEDKTVEVLVKKKKINITGIAETNKKFNKIAKKYTKDKSINIAIAHNPDKMLDLPINYFDYLLLGHFHGGQIWMPFNLEYKVLRHEKTVKMGYRKGKYVYNGMNVYINRGLGNVLLPFRLFSRPEIAIINI